MEKIAHEFLSMPMHIKDSLVKIFSSNYKIIYYGAGCASHLLGWFTLIPGASKAIMEVSTPYSKGAMINLLKYEPKQYVSVEGAMDLCQKAYINTQKYLLIEHNNEIEKISNEGIIGISATGSLKTYYEKKGDHHGYIAVMIDQKGYVYSFKLRKNLRIREEEDLLISETIVQCLEDTIEARKFENKGGLVNFNSSNGPEYKIINTQSESNSSLESNNQITLSNSISKFNEDEYFQLINDFDIYPHMIEQLDKGHLMNMIHMPNGKTLYDINLNSYVILSGSFNPIHEGHIQLANTTAKILGIPESKVIFELSISNIDKGLINIEETKKRVEAINKHGFIAMITKLPLFKDKNIYLENGYFLLGADTFKRLIDIQYYSNSFEMMIGTLAEFNKRNNKILVAPRIDTNTGKLLELSNLTTPEILKNIVSAIDFRMDISSTEIRKKTIG